MNKVIKRDGRTVKFDRERIINAVKRAFEATEGETFDDYALNKANHIADYVEKYINEQNKNVSVENIQDIVEKGLMSCKKKDVAKEYILYREKRTRERDRNSKFRHVIKTKLMATDVQNQNANVDEHSFGGRTGEAASELNRQVALDEVISPMARRNHLNNEIYEHDLDHFVLGDHNCFKKNTKFITNYGIKTFESFRDGDKIKVLNKDNKWVDATVHYYGKQKMQIVTLSRCGIKKEVGCTPNHRWILSDGTVTDNLQVGDRLYPLNEYKEPKLESLRDYEMFAYGFLLGDGCDHRCKNIDNIQVRLCDKKNKYGYIFEQAKYHKQNIKNSNDVVYTKRTTVKKQDFLDNKIWNILSLKDKINLFNGFYAADGNQTTHTKAIYTSDDRILNMIKDISALAGYHIYKIKTIIHNTEYKQNAKLYEIIFTVKYSINSTWKVENIEMRSHNKFEAWCIDEPKTHSFMLDGGIITGNCLSIPFDDILKNGFNVKQTDVRPANSVNTAFQLVAVIFQIQSLNQFGGVSATHIDWTMIPYVRKSFMKHYITAMLKDTDDFAKLNLMQMLFETYKESVYGRYTITRDKFDDWVDEHKEQILKDNNLTQDDFYFDNENLNPKYKQSAMFDTIKETYQAVEGLFHNLNTLQSRSGNQLEKVAGFTVM